MTEAIKSFWSNHRESWVTKSVAGALLCVIFWAATSFGQQTLDKRYVTKEEHKQALDFQKEALDRLEKKADEIGKDVKYLARRPYPPPRRGVPIDEEE